MLSYDVLRLAEELDPSDERTVATEVVYGVLTRPDEGQLVDRDGVLHWSWR